MLSELSGYGTFINYSDDPEEKELDEGLNEQELKNLHTMFHIIDTEDEENKSGKSQEDEVIPPCDNQIRNKINELRFGTVFCIFTLTYGYLLSIMNYCKLNILTKWNSEFSGAVQGVFVSQVLAAVIFLKVKKFDKYNVSKMMLVYQIFALLGVLLIAFNSHSLLLYYFGVSLIYSVFQLNFYVINEISGAIYFKYLDFHPIYYGLRYCLVASVPIIILQDHVFYSMEEIYGFMVIFVLIAINQILGVIDCFLDGIYRDLKTTVQIESFNVNMSMENIFANRKQQFQQ